MSPETWHGCYDAGWHDYIVPAAFAHPAKMARGLLTRIYDELLVTGALRRGDVVVDPFGGIGSTAIIGAIHGLQVVCCELEPRFVDLARQNVERHRRAWECVGHPIPVIVQGDSRRLREHIGPVLADCVVSSPPYSNEGLGHVKSHHANQNLTPCERRSGKRSNLPEYGDCPGQLARMAEGLIDAVISSPPYAEIASGAGGLNTLPPKHAGQQGGRSVDSASQDTDQRYGETSGQLARMACGSVDAILSSPPYPQPYTGGGGINVKGYGLDGADKVGARTYQSQGAAREAGNLETLPAGVVDAVVSSPPYEGSNQNYAEGRKRIEWEKGVRAGMKNDRISGPESAYPNTPGQMGETQGDTFWSAARDIVQECYAVLEPGGVAVWVVKAFVRNKQVVDFPGDWRRLCESVGFETIREIHASLVSEERRPDLFDGERVTTKSRKSFFRRLAEAKGSPRIDHEVVLFMRTRDAVR